ncbi:flagellar biosynthesis protein FlgA [Arthrobacter cheniae]|uniref:Flagellar biosynthesis protein FlgA n=1 Tax=Arthrobacter cheniae TaxID=1258888 RepID=A0A3A5M731_9MICC|nr:RcpC/CpaB family pilus assembly protein [Arthrobacter cheniae]RJT82952.1 flagellar biosynthesis protein FlgA [Arthrobacter cheniae]
MKSRLIAGVAAVVLALVGAMLVFGYAQAADTRAVQGLDPVAALVVQEEVPAGTTVEELTPFLETKLLPSNAVAEGAVKDLSSSGGLVTDVDLLPGEQLLAERLVDPATTSAAAAVDVPPGLQEISFSLEPQRVVGGKIAPGDSIGIFVSMTEGGLEDAPEERTTQLVLHQILVTSVQRAPLDVAAADPAADPAEAARAEAEALPTGSLMLTVAVDDVQATKIAFGSEFGTLWLSKEPLDATRSVPPITLQDKDLYR